MREIPDRPASHPRKSWFARGFGWGFTIAFLADVIVMLGIIFVSGSRDSKTLWVAFGVLNFPSLPFVLGIMAVLHLPLDAMGGSAVLIPMVVFSPVVWGLLLAHITGKLDRLK